MYFEQREIEKDTVIHTQRKTRKERVKVEDVFKTVDSHWII